MCLGLGISFLWFLARLFLGGCLFFWWRDRFGGLGKSCSFRVCLSFLLLGGRRFLRLLLSFGRGIGCFICFLDFYLVLVLLGG